MPKQKTSYVCQSCEYKTGQWVGQCPNCGEWNTLVETLVIDKPSTGLSSRSSRMSSGSFAGFSNQKPIQLSKVDSKTTARVMSGLKEFDRVLGGGFVPGQVVLLAGDPGIGKSTILTQIASSMSKTQISYVCGEESVYQVKVRADRMGYKGENLTMFSETDVDIISSEITSLPESQKPGLIIVDSVQTITSSDFMGVAGSVGQVRGSCQKLTQLAKSISIPIVLVGHVTKEGTLAGPKVLEHIVDTVLYLEGDAQHMFRILKTTKNRFGAVSEVGIFEMNDKGMSEVDNPSKIFLNQKLQHTPGSCVTVVMEGFRPLLFEIQALTVKTAFGYPRRTTSGFNVNRLQLLIAIIEKTCGINLSGHDVYINVAGGFKVSEYSCDLAVCLAIVSSIKDMPIDDNAIVFGECGLSGEVRKVTYNEKRIQEAQKLGFDKLITPSQAKTVYEAVKLLSGSSKKPYSSPNKSAQSPAQKANSL